MEMMEAWFILGDIKHFFGEMLWGKHNSCFQKKAKGYIIVHRGIGVFFFFEFQALLLVKKKKKKVDYLYLWHVAVKVKLVLGEEMTINTVIKLDWKYSFKFDLKSYGESALFILWCLLL